ncbi:hypothetical protein O4H61_10685 [Roseovarius aestuarii]|nr:hypothetical protein [Roseovarius aestuarii]
MSDPDIPRPIFVGRRTYRRRRMADAAALLPVLGTLLLLMPLLWAGGQDGARTSDVMIYLFCVWGGLGVLSGVVSRYLRPEPSEDSPEVSPADATLVLRAAEHDGVTGPE